MQQFWSDIIFCTSFFLHFFQSLYSDFVDLSPRIGLFPSLEASHSWSAFIWEQQECGLGLRPQPRFFFSSHQQYSYIIPEELLFYCSCSFICFGTCFILTLFEGSVKFLLFVICSVISAVCISSSVLLLVALKSSLFSVSAFKKWSCVLLQGVNEQSLPAIQVHTQSVLLLLDVMYLVL